MTKTCFAVPQGTIYIRADGSIDPPTAPISTVDNITYTLTGDISLSETNDALRVERSNVILDGSNYIIHSVPGGGGVGLYTTINVTVKNFNVDGGSVGIGLYDSSYCNIVDNNLTSSILYGSGVWLGNSFNNTVDNNTVSNRGSGIYFIDSNYNIATNNSLTNNSEGLWFYENCFNNTFVNNNITTNAVGIKFSFSPNNNNVIYHNNFMNNSSQVSSSGSTNLWDNGLEGNYWSDYNGTDSNQDGIGDTPYFIDENNIDHYPLMTQYVIPEFPSFLVLPLFFIATLLAVIVYKRKHPQNQSPD